MIKFLLLFLLSFNLYAKTLVLIGGGQRPTEALTHFVLKKKAGPIYVLPWGTSYPEESFETIKNELQNLGSFDVRCFCEETFSAKDRIDLLNAGAVYFPGGNQNKVMDRIFKFQLKELIIDLYNRDVPIAGTSAGTAIQSNPMLTGVGLETAEGLGLLEHFIVDQHFLVRNRQERLLGVLAHHPTFHGMGIDENMSAVIEEAKTITALGPTLVTLYLRVNNQMEVIELAHGQSFNKSF